MPLQPKPAIRAETLGSQGRHGAIVAEIVRAMPENRSAAFNPPAKTRTGASRALKIAQLGRRGVLQDTNRSGRISCKSTIS